MPKREKSKKERMFGGRGGRLTRTGARKGKVVGITWSSGGRLF